MRVITNGSGLHHTPQWNLKFQAGRLRTEQVKLCAAQLKRNSSWFLCWAAVEESSTCSPRFNWTICLSACSCYCYFVRLILPILGRLDLYVPERILLSLLLSQHHSNLLCAYVADDHESLSPPFPSNPPARLQTKRVRNRMWNTWDKEPSSMLYPCEATYAMARKNVDGENAEKRQEELETINETKLCESVLWKKRAHKWNA
jgi:hypothetical protein